MISYISISLTLGPGFSFYSFFAMLVENLGGADYAIQEMKAIDRSPCGCCGKVDHHKFYGRVRWALFQFLFIRPLVELGTAIFHYVDSQPLFLVCSFVAVVQFLFGFIYLVTFCECCHPVVPCYPSNLCCSRQRLPAQRQSPCYAQNIPAEGVRWPLYYSRYCLSVCVQCEGQRALYL